MPDLKLGTVAERLGIKIKNTHRALQDVLVNAEVFKKFLLFNNSMATNIAKADIKVPKQKEKTKSEISKIYKCPSCQNGFLQLRKNKAKGNSFYGCSEFPRCRKTCEAQEVDKYKVRE